MSLANDARLIMSRAGFSNKKVRESIIWAAKYQRCPTCKASTGKPCLNLNKLKRDIEQPTSWPHDPRIDWGMLVEKLHARGYR